MVGSNQSFSKSVLRWLGTGAIFGLLLSLRELKFYTRAKLKGTFAQHGEDKFLLDYFGGKRGVYVDIGASHPFIISNTYLLWKHGWRGITVEPIPYLYQRHLRFRKGDVALNMAVSDKAGQLQFHQLIPSVLSTFDAERAQRHLADGCILRSVAEIEVVTLARIYNDSLRGKEVDVLSIDVEGMDLSVLRGNDWSLMAPRLIVCEINEESTTEIDSYLQQLRYRVIKEVGCNRIYERSY